MRRGPSPCRTNLSSRFAARLGRRAPQEGPRRPFAFWGAPYYKGGHQAGGDQLESQAREVGEDEVAVAAHRGGEIDVEIEEQLQGGHHGKGPRPPRQQERQG